MSAYNTIVAGLSASGLVLLGFVATHGQSDFHMSAAQMQATLQAKAEAALHDGDFGWATITMDGQVATITGNAPSDGAIAAAQQLVLTSAGPGGWLRGGIVRVETELTEATEVSVVSPFVWRATKTEGQDYILTGVVPSEALQTELATAAMSVMPNTLSDRTKLAEGAPDGDWGEIAKFGLTQLQKLDSGEARLTDRVLKVSGIAMDDANRIAVTAAVSNLSDPWQGIARISGPSLWTAEHIDGALVLSGSCETDADRAEIAQIAQTHFDGPIIDNMTVADTQYEDWIQGVRLGLPHFTQFESGEMAFEPEEIGFTFDGEASTSTLQFLREDMGKLEGDYAVTIDAEPVAVILEELQGVDLGDDPLQACQASFDLIMDANAVMFETGNAVISRESGITLDKIMAVSDTCAETLLFEVGGHTDTSGAREANMTLSQDRAQAVANYMRDAGFEAERLIVKGYGPDIPKTDNETPEGRAMNRRIEFTVQERSE
ncbi:OmpA family protein [Hyphomonas sp. FCG-A18]|uniref:OmpA family protein n=1 Tax=Hyphomonas sp. FCG-A18 TaxID=3080019 RepID=UPI002B306F70|nr:OmpA family protein [Hyphomonas sp. FCG-A18]